MVLILTALRSRDFAFKTNSQIYIKPSVFTNQTTEKHNCSSTQYIYLPLTAFPNISALPSLVPVERGPRLVV